MLDIKQITSSKSGNIIGLGEDNLLYWWDWKNRSWQSFSMDIENLELRARSIYDLELPTRTQKALEKNNIRSVGGLIRRSKEYLNELEGLGPSSIERIEKELEKIGFKLSTN